MAIVACMERCVGGLLKFIDHHQLVWALLLPLFDAVDGEIEHVLEVDVAVARELGLASHYFVGE